jgi:hypothetical protein
MTFRFFEKANSGTNPAFLSTYAMHGGVAALALAAGLCVAGCASDPYHSKGYDDPKYTVDIDSESPINTEATPQLVISKLEASNRAMKNRPAPGDSNTQDVLGAFPKLRRVIDGGWGDIIAETRTGRERDAVNYLREHHLRAVLYQPYVWNDKGDRYTGLSVEAEPFGYWRAIRRMKDSRLFRFVSRYPNGAGGGMVFVAIPKATVFSGGPNSHEGEVFLTKIVQEAFPASKGYITTPLRTKKPFCYYFDLVGRGDTLFSHSSGNWDKARVSLYMGDDGFIDKPGMVELLLNVDAKTTKGPKDKLPPDDRFHESNQYDAEQIVAAALVREHEWEIF